MLIQLYSTIFFNAQQEGFGNGNSSSIPLTPPPNHTPTVYLLTCLYSHCQSYLTRSDSSVAQTSQVSGSVPHINSVSLMPTNHAQFPGNLGKPAGKSALQDVFARQYPCACGTRMTRQEGRERRVCGQCVYCL